MPYKLIKFLSLIFAHVHNSYSIGYAIARRLGLDGASVMVSSRRQHNVQQAVEKLKEENINVAGTVCHVGKQEDRTQLIQEVGIVFIVLFSP